MNQIMHFPWNGIVQDFKYVAISVNESESVKDSNLFEMTPVFQRICYIFDQAAKKEVEFTVVMKLSLPLSNLIQLDILTPATWG